MNLKSVIFMRVNYQRLSRTPLDLRLKIVREYLSGDASREELGLRYQVKPGTISQWVHRYGNAEKFVSLTLAKETPSPMARTKKTPPEEENEALKKRLKELEERLHYAELQNLALNTMIDIAEEQGIQIRKKSGAKQ